MNGGTVETVLALGLSNAALATVLAVVAFGVSRASRHPPLAHFAWFLVLLKLVAPPCFEIPSAGVAGLGWLRGGLERLSREVPPHREALRGSGLSGPRPEPAPVPAALSPAPAPPAPAPEPPLVAAGFREPPPAGSSPESPRLLALAAPALLLAWAGGALLLLVVARVRSLRFDRLLRCARPAPGAIVEKTRAVALRFGLRRPPEVVIVDARIPPLIWAPWGRPKLVLPSGLLPGLSEEQVRMLIAHELAHLRRRDHWRRWFELVAVAVSWWNPVAWWARRELRQAEEQCCDAWVQREFAPRVREYARALLETVEFLSASRAAVPRTASGLGEASSLRRRFQMILERKPCHRLSTPLRGVLIALGAAVLPWAPGGAFGQKPAADDRLEAGEGAGGAAPEGAGGAVLARPSTPEGEGDLERRLARLEARLAELVEELRPLRASAAPRLKGVRSWKPLAGEAAPMLRDRLLDPQAPSWRLHPEGPEVGVTVDGTTYVFKKLEGAIEAVDAASGKARWRTMVSGFRSPEISVKGGVVVLQDRGAKGPIALLDAATGWMVFQSGEGTGRNPLLPPGAGDATAAPLPWLAPAPPVGPEAAARWTPAGIEAEKTRLEQRLEALEVEKAGIREALRQLEPRLHRPVR